MKTLTQMQEEILQTNTIHELLNVKSSLIGKTGIVSQEFTNMKNLSVEEKKEKGASLNQLKNQIEQAIELQMQKIKKSELDLRLANEKVDISTPSKTQEGGTLHPVSFVANEITQFFGNYGFSVHDGPEVEDDYHNFEALNFPKLHPARNMHDTFYIQNTEELLRTHTSSVQVRHMQNSTPPFRFISVGKTYRCDSDRTHIPMFHQAEGVCVEEGITLAHLKTIVEVFLRSFFENSTVEIRFRSSFFPFTEPSFEVDINTGNGFLEVMGCGIIHPNVMKNCGIDAKFSGFAFGMGLERLAMLKYGISDVRDCVSSRNDWQKHYGFAV